MTTQIQAQITHNQTLYKKWLDIQNQEDYLWQLLKERVSLSAQLQDFYFEGQWLRYYSAIDEGLAVDLATDGEYSVMNQDTIWNMCIDERYFWQQLQTLANATVALMDADQEGECDNNKNYNDNNKK